MWDALGAGHTPRSEPLLDAALRRGGRSHPRPGAVRAPTGGSGHFLAPQIYNRAGAHACVVRCGLRWHRGTYAISARSRPGLESRSRRDRVRAARPPKAVDSYLTVFSSSFRYDLPRESCWDSRGVANGARPRAHPLWGHVGSGPPGPGRRNCQRAAGSRLRPPGRPSTIPGANHISKSRCARSNRWRRP